MLPDRGSARNVVPQLDVSLVQRIESLTGARQATPIRMYGKRHDAEVTRDIGRRDGLHLQTGHNCPRFYSLRATSDKTAVMPSSYC